MGIEKSLEKIKEQAEDIIEKAAKQTKLETTDFDLTCKAIKTLHHIKQMENGDIMMRENGYFGNSYQMPYLHEMSYMRGRDPATGRYTSRDAGTDSNMNNRYYDGYSARRYYDAGNMTNDKYSGHTSREAKIETLNEMLATAQNEQERQLIQKWLRHVEQNY